MSEKRFRTNDLVKFDYSEIGEYVDEKHTPTPLRNDEVCKLLNEQEATINALKEENEQLRKDCFKFKKDYLINTSDIELLNIQQATITELKEENEQLREINKELGDDLYNCRLNKNIISEKLKLWQDTLAEYDIYTIKDFAESFELDSEISKEKDEKIKELEVKVLNLELKNEELMKNE